MRRVIGWRPGWRLRWRSLAGLLLLGTATLLIGGLLWLWWDAGRARDAWFEARRGTLADTDREALEAAGGIAAERVRLLSDSGLAVTLRVLRPARYAGRLPVLMLLGGHRTGADAVELFDDIGRRAVVALDYPYEGRLSTRGLADAVAALPAIRAAFRDSVPAIWLALDWLEAEPWTDRSRVAMVGVSLGVPFAATAAARDERFDALMLVHGAADNRRWIAQNLARRYDLGLLEPAAAVLLNWTVYGPLHDTAAHVAAIAPRPVVIVGADDDERVPAGQTQVLYDAAREPKRLRWTDGRHVQPGRTEVVHELMTIADEELARLWGR